MEKYILITAEANDSDFFTKKSDITDDQIEKIKSIVNKMPKYAEGYNKGLIPYCTNDQGTDNYPDSSYNNLTNSEKEFLDGFIPDGYDYCGIHTIYNIDIIQIIETIL